MLTVRISKTLGILYRTGDPFRDNEGSSLSGEEGTSGDDDSEQLEELDLCGVTLIETILA